MALLAADITLRVKENEIKIKKSALILRIRNETLKQYCIKTILKCIFTKLHNTFYQNNIINTQGRNYSNFMEVSSGNSS